MNHGPVTDLLKSSEAFMCFHTVSTYFVFFLLKTFVNHPYHQLPELFQSTSNPSVENQTPAKTQSLKPLFTADNIQTYLTPSTPAKPCLEHEPTSQHLISIHRNVPLLTPISHPPPTPSTHLILHQNHNVYTNPHYLPLHNPLGIPPHALRS